MIRKFIGLVISITILLVLLVAPLSLKAKQNTPDSWNINGLKLDNFDVEFKKLENIKEIKKDKYESDETYNNRISNLKIDKAIKFYANLTDKDAVYEDTLGTITYDSNSRTLEIFMSDGMGAKFAMDYRDESPDPKLTGSFISVKDKSNRRGTYVGSNAFGVSKRITKWERISSVLVITASKELGSNLDDDSLRMKLEMSNNLAGKLRGGYGLMFIGKIDKPYFGRSSDYKSPKIDSPFEVNFTYKYLKISLDEIWLIADKTKDILVKFKEDGTEVNPKYLADIILSSYKIQHEESESDIASALSNNTIDQNGNYALHTAIFDGKPKTALALIKSGPQNINLRNKFGATPLHLAVASENKEIIKALLDAGADVTIKDNDGATPLDDAKKKGLSESFVNLKNSSQTIPQ